MEETRIIRGRKVVFERKEPVETLRYSLDVFDAGDNLIEVPLRTPATIRPAIARRQRRQAWH